MANFKELLVWQKSIDLVTEIYRTTDAFPKEETFGLKSQIRRASVLFRLILQKETPEEANRIICNF